MSAGWYVFKITRERNSLESIVRGDLFRPLSGPHPTYATAIAAGNYVVPKFRKDYPGEAHNEINVYCIEGDPLPKGAFNDELIKQNMGNLIGVE